MINSNLLTDELAEKMAGEAVKFHIAAEAGRILRHMVIGSIKETLKEDDKKRAHDILFTALFKSLAPFEKQFQAMLKRIWGEEERILIANIKKMKKAWLRKDKIDDIMYPRKPFEKKLTTESREVIVETMKKQGDIEAAKLEARLKHKGYTKADEPLSISFDVNNPEVQKWLDSYVPMFSEKLEEVNVKKLRATLIEGIEAGEGVPQLTNRVYETYKDWGFKRAEGIARTETIRASNAGAKSTYLQSGVVEKIIWLSFLDERTCGFCLQMDGKVINVKENFFDLGDTFTIESGGNKQSMNIDYTPCEYPPLHPRCRCTISAMIEEGITTERVNFHKNLTASEKGVIKGYTHKDYMFVRRYLTGNKTERAAFRKEVGDKVYKATQKKAKTMDNLFTKYKDGAASDTIHRGLSELNESTYNQFKAYKKGDTIEIDNALTSWTKDKSKVEEYSSGNHGIKFHLKGARKTTKELDVGKYSIYSDEEEIIIKDIKFKITKIKEVTNPQFIHQKWLDVYLEEIG